MSDAENSTESGRMIAGAILAAVGAIITVTGLGAIVGLPLLVFGVFVMFPDATRIVVLLALWCALVYLFYFA